MITLGKSDVLYSQYINQCFISWNPQPDNARTFSLPLIVLSSLNTLLKYCEK